jgi:hypothetical protein
MSKSRVCASTKRLSRQRAEEVRSRKAFTNREGVQVASERFNVWAFCQDECGPQAEPVAVVSAANTIGKYDYIELRDPLEFNEFVRATGDNTFSLEEVQYLKQYLPRIDLDHKLLVEPARATAKTCSGWKLLVPMPGQTFFSIGTRDKEGRPRKAMSMFYHDYTVADAALHVDQSKDFQCFAIARREVNRSAPSDSSPTP